MPTPRPMPSTLNKPKAPVGAAAVAAYQKQVSPKGVASAEAAAKKALYDRYGMTIPETRTTAGVKKK